MNLTALMGGLAQGSALVLGIWLILHLLGRVAPDTRAWLWRLAFLKLACSALAIGTVSVHILPSLRAEPPISQSAEAAETPVMPFGVGQEMQETSAMPATIPEPPAPPQPPVSGQETPVPPTNQSDTTFDVLVLVLWSAGVVFFGLRPVVDALKVRRWLRLADPVADATTLSCLKQLSSRAGLKRVPDLLSSDSAPSPMVYGIWRPVVILPKRMVCSPAEDLRMALAHEIAHIRRQDLAWGIIAWIVRAALFFNPVAWIAERELRAAQESATDQEAVWMTGSTINAYGEMLLRAMVPNRVTWNPSSIPMFDSFQNAQRRLQAMKYFSNSSSLTRKLAGLAPVAIGTLALPTYILVPAQADPIDPAPVTRTHRQISAVDEAAPVVSKHSRSVSKVQAHSPVMEHRVSHPSVLVMSVRPVENRAKSSPLTSHPKTVRTPQSFVLGADSIRSEDLKAQAKEAKDECEQRVSMLVTSQNQRIAQYRKGADQRELEAEQREREAQQRKREGEQRARAALLRKEVIEQRESDGYRFAEPGQRTRDLEQRADDARQNDADQYQLRLDQKQRETDQWQREFDAKSIAAMRQETQGGISAARSDYQARLQELIADDLARRTAGESLGVAGGVRMHVVRTAAGLSLAIPNGYSIARVKTGGNGAYTVVLQRAKG